jgi:uncharacterized protein
MSEHDGAFAPGTPCWSDLGVDDVGAARTFYAEVFGWDLQDGPPEVGGYVMALLDGRPVAGIGPTMGDGRPTGWTSSLATADADATATTVTSAGGSVLTAPFDVMDAGRMAIVQDPQGAYFLPWQPNTNIGADLVNTPGALVWNELTTPDLDASEDFYGDLFGWRTEIAPGPMEYRTIQRADGGLNGGMRPPMPPGTPPFWLVYFGTADITAAASEVTDLGGTVLAPPMAIEGLGELAVAQDPQGAVFALYAGNFDD